MSELGFPKEEVGILRELELAKPQLPDVFDYDASVIRFQDIRRKTGEGFKRMIEELWIARECLAVRTGRPRKVKCEGAKTRSWMEFLDAVGLARSTVHVWLTNAFPDRDREITLPAKKLPPKSSTPERVMTPKEAAAGLKDQALGNAIGNAEWGGEENPESRDGTNSHVEEADEDALSPAQQEALIRERLIVVRIKISRHPDSEKVRAAQKLLSELFMLFSVE